MKHFLDGERFPAGVAILLMLLLALTTAWVPDSLSEAQIAGGSSAPVPPQTPTPAEMAPEAGETALAPSGTPTRAGMENRRRILRPTLPASATQADGGAQVYNLVCSACHAYTGEGLTDEWRATWAPPDQNCWQMKCHAASHPPDGFEIPRYVPPVVGPAITGRFRTALDLFEYLKAEMPWQEPGSLQEDEYWEVTAFLVRLMGVDPVRIPLDPQRAAEVLLRPGQGQAGVAVSSSAPATLIPPTTIPSSAHASPMPGERMVTPPAVRNPIRMWTPVLGLAIAGVVVGLVAGVLLAARSRRLR
jgi:cytochrome c5